jgi:hypothetical protein
MLNIVCVWSAFYPEGIGQSVPRALIAEWRADVREDNHQCILVDVHSEYLLLFNHDSTTTTLSSSRVVG